MEGPRQMQELGAVNCDDLVCVGTKSCTNKVGLGKFICIPVNFCKDSI